MHIFVMQYMAICMNSYSVMVERQVQSVGDHFQNRVDNLVHQMHSCRLGEQVKSGFMYIFC